ncbi:MAG: hypothetical protein R3Y28_00005 [Candidatus Gastranaerophilales bacterium]
MSIEFGIIIVDNVLKLTSSHATPSRHFRLPIPLPRRGACKAGWLQYIIFIFLCRQENETKEALDNACEKINVVT